MNNHFWLFCFIWGDKVKIAFKKSKVDYSSKAKTFNVHDFILPKTTVYLMRMEHTRACTRVYTAVLNLVDLYTLVIWLVLLFIMLNLACLPELCRLAEWSKAPDCRCTQVRGVVGSSPAETAYFCYYTLVLTARGVRRSLDLHVVGT